MQDDGKRCVALARMVVAAFKPPVGAVEDDFRHLLTPSARHRADLRLAIDSKRPIWGRRTPEATLIDGRIHLPTGHNCDIGHLTDVDIAATWKAGCGVFSVNAAFIAITICGTGS